MKKFFLLGTFLFFAIFLLRVSSVFAALSCTVSTSCSDVTVFKMSGTTNAHAEIPSQSNYPQLVCCSGITGLGNSCSDPSFGVVARLSAVTNAHVEANIHSNYANDVCLSTSSADSIVTVGYQNTNCTGYDTTIASLSGATNAHVGDSSAYTSKICATITQASLTFSIDDLSVGFGPLSSTTGRWATGDTLGTDASGTTPVTAHTMTIATSASSGYSLSYLGPTLTSGANTIAGTTTIPASSVTDSSDGTPGTEEFGLSVEASCGTACVGAAYRRGTDDSKWRFTANVLNNFVQENGPTAGTTIDLSYLANISSVTPSGDYSTIITYIATGNF